MNSNLKMRHFSKINNSAWKRAIDLKPEPNWRYVVGRTKNPSSISKFVDVCAELQGHEYMVVGQKNHVCLNNSFWTANFKNPKIFQELLIFFLSIKKKVSKKLNGARF